MTHTLADQLREILQDIGRLQQMVDIANSVAERERNPLLAFDVDNAQAALDLAIPSLSSLIPAISAMEADTFDYHRVREWALSKPREPANIAFTASANRNAARLIEEVEAQACPSGVGVDESIPVYMTVTTSGP